MDGLGYKDFSYGCKRVFGERWALVGEAFASWTRSTAPAVILLPTPTPLPPILLFVISKVGPMFPSAPRFTSPFTNNSLLEPLGSTGACTVVLAMAQSWPQRLFGILRIIGPFQLLFFQDKLTDISPLLGRVRDILEGTSKLSAQVQGDFKYWYENGAGDLDGRFVDIPGIL